jgi:uncharacterized protein YgiM (DUF1202 family)
MPNLKVLFRVSIAILIVNLMLVGFVFFNKYQTSLEREKLANAQESEVLGASSVPIFNPSFVLGDESFSSTRVCSSPDAIQSILNRYNSPLRNYSEQGRSAAYWIWSAARGQTSTQWGVSPRLNPCMILAYLEKEQSLLSGQFTASQLQSRIGVAMGSGCPDFAGCNAKYKGFVNQLNWASYQLQFNYNLARSTKTTDAYQVRRTIYTLDGINVFLSNAATASSYRYTPHVYYGNYNLWKIMTANGWGSSSATYTLQSLDSINIPNRKNILNEQFANRIKRSDVQDLLTNPPAIGTTNEKVKLLQEFLRQEGFFNYPLITGFYGSVTETARQNYLAEDSTRNQRQQACNALYAKSWSIGQTGDDVKTLQECLKTDGVYAWPSITGYYGPVSEQGLNTIRSRRGIGQGSATTPENKATKPQPNPATSAGTQAQTSRNNSIAAALNLRSSACGSQIGRVAWGTSGTLLEGPIRKTCLGSTWGWYKVKFSTGQTGWVAGNYVSFSSKPVSSIVQTPAVTPTPGFDKTKYSIIYKTNNRRVNIKSLNVRQEPCGKSISLVSWGTEGGYLEGPIRKTCFEGTWDWYKVKFSTGQTGWVAGFYLDVVKGQSNSGEKYTTSSRGLTNSGLNLRNQPCGTTLSIIPWNSTVIKVGDSTQRNCLGSKISWIRITAANGQTGWVASQYLTKI